MENTSKQDVALPVLQKNEVEEATAFAKNIDLTKTQSVINYGVQAQTSINDFSQKVLGSQTLHKSGEIGDEITGLIMKLRGITEPKKSIRNLFGLIRYNAATAVVRNTNTDSVINEVDTKMKSHLGILQDNIELLEKLEKVNGDHYKQLEKYIIAGDIALKEQENEPNSESFAARLSDLRVSKTMTLQLAVQVRMIKQTHLALIHKIQSSINLTIPIWRTHMLVNANINAGAKALEAQNAITDMTNKMIGSNSATLRATMTETAVATTKTVIDTQTLKKSNDDIIGALTEITSIIRDGKMNREKVDGELKQIESNLKQFFDKHYSGNEIEGPRSDSGMEIKSPASSLEFK